MRLSERHRKLDENGVGLCSVPMWKNGVPDGFCDREAYGFPSEEARLERYIPGLACGFHGGPAMPRPKLRPKQVPTDEQLLSIETEELRMILKKEGWIKERDIPCITMVTDQILGEQWVKNKTKEAEFCFVPVLKEHFRYIHNLKNLLETINYEVIL